MRDQLESALGLYSPSFFKIQINVPELLDNPLNMSPANSAAFIHEYVHFLQDVTTTYGLKNIISVVDYLRTVNANQLNSGNPILPIPYIPEQRRDGGAYYNGELEKLHLGTKRLDYAGAVEEIQVSVTPVDLGYEVKNIEKVELRIPGSETLYQFGSHAVLESMAYEVEQAIYPGVLDQPTNYCYFSAAEIIRFCYPALLENRQNLITLCDAALMYYNPGIIFYRAVREMNERGFNPASPGDIFDFVFENFPMSFHNLEEVDHIYNNHTATAISLLEGYFTTDLFSNNRQWMRFTLAAANGIRNQSWEFFTQLAAGGTLDSNPIFRELYGRLGMPLLVNANGVALFATPLGGEFNPELMWVINQIYNIYWNVRLSQIRRCGLTEWCQESCEAQGRDDYTDQRCWDAPWTRVHDRELCPFAQIWRMWGLQDVIPTPPPRNYVSE